VDWLRHFGYNATFLILGGAALVHSLFLRCKCRRLLKEVGFPEEKALNQELKTGIQNHDWVILKARGSETGSRELLVSWGPISSTKSLAPPAPST
jgi:hypothetical protein